MDAISERSFSTCMICRKWFRIKSTSNLETPNHTPKGHGRGRQGRWCVRATTMPGLTWVTGSGGWNGRKECRLPAESHPRGNHPPKGHGRGRGGGVCGQLRTRADGFMKTTDGGLKISFASALGWTLEDDHRQIRSALRNAQTAKMAMFFQYFTEQP